MLTITGVTTPHTVSLVLSLSYTQHGRALARMPDNELNREIFKQQECPLWVGSGLSGLYHPNGRFRPKADIGEASELSKFILDQAIQCIELFPEGNGWANSDEFIRHLREPDHERRRIIFVTVTTTIPEMFPVAVRYGQTNKYSSP